MLHETASEKQVITIDAALLTFGVAFIQNITKSRGPTGFIDIIIFIVYLWTHCPGRTCYNFYRSTTHSGSGSINDFWVRWPAFGCIVFICFGRVLHHRMVCIRYANRSGDASPAQSQMSKFHQPASVKTTAIRRQHGRAPVADGALGLHLSTSYTVAVYNSKGQFASESTVSTPRCGQRAGRYHRRRAEAKDLLSRERLAQWWEPRPLEHIRLIHHQVT